MKKILIIAIICFWASNSVAQESDPWVGTWYSEPTYSLAFHSDYHDEVLVKVILRIDKLGDKYRIRCKYYPVRDRENVRYEHPHEGTPQDNKLYFESKGVSSEGTHFYWNWCYTLNDGSLTRVCYNSGYYGGGAQTVNHTDWEKGTCGLGQPITFYKDDDF